MERVLALAQSVGAFARFRQPSDDGIKWPNTPQDIARVLCTQAGFLCTLHCIVVVPMIMLFIVN